VRSGAVAFSQPPSERLSSAAPPAAFVVGRQAAPA
jgi:hypothetical protein